MGLLAKKGGGDEERDPSGTSLDMERKHCPVCRRELPPWREECPDDGARLVNLADMPADDGPSIPAHLLDGLDDDPAPGDDAEDDAEDDADAGAPTWPDHPEA